MRKTRLFFAATFLTFMAFGTVTYTSCKKDQCSGVACQNGGTCSGGNCTCPTGYTGSLCETAATTTIAYQNTTFTPISITANGSTQIIPVGGTVSYTGEYGTSMSYTAYTYGQTSTGAQVGEKVIWNSTHTFPSSGTTTIPLDVASTLFFLKLQDKDAYYSVNGVYVNYNTTEQTYDAIAFPNNGLVYNIGYYNAYTNTELYIQSNSSGSHWSGSPSFSFVSNQSFTFIMD